MKTLFATLAAVAVLFTAAVPEAHAACKTGAYLYDAAEEFWLDWLDNPAMDFEHVGGEWSNCPFNREVWESVLPPYHATFQVRLGQSCSGSTIMDNNVKWWNGSAWVLYGNYRCNCPVNTTVCAWF